MMSQEDVQPSSEEYESRFLKLPRFCKVSDDDDFREVPDGCVRRCVILDAPNIMHGGSVDDDPLDPDNAKKFPDVMALLALMRYFVLNDFEVLAFTTIGVTYKTSSNYKAAIDELVSHRLLEITPRGNLDDVIALYAAVETNGVVLSQDQYRDHQAELEDMAEIVQNHVCSLTYGQGFRPEKYGITSDGRHFLCAKDFALTAPHGRTLQDFFLSNNESDVRHGISVERRQENWTSSRQKSILELLTRLLVDGTTTCEANLRAIRAWALQKKLEGEPAKTDDSGPDEEPEGDYVFADDDDEDDF